MLLRLIKEGHHIDEIIFVDCGPWEFDQMRHHVDQVEKIISRPITRLQLEKSLDYYMFEYIPSNPKDRIRIWESQGVKGLAWPTPVIRWCNNVKRKAITRAVSVSTQYVGISADEPHRMGRCQQRGTTKLYPLVDWGMTAQDCFDYCYSFGLDWGGLYKHFTNTSCWCCPLKPLPALRNIRLHYPDLWLRLLDMDKRAWNTFKPRGITVQSLETRFDLECKGLLKIPLLQQKKAMILTRNNHP